MKVLLNDGGLSVYAEGPGELALLDQVAADHVKVKKLPGGVNASVGGGNVFLYKYLLELGEVCADTETELKLF